MMMFDLFLERWPIYLGIALVVAIIVVVIVYLMSKLNSSQGCQALDYVKEGSFNVTNQQNQYMGTTVTRVPIQSNNRR